MHRSLHVLVFYKPAGVQCHLANIMLSAPQSLVLGVGGLVVPIVAVHDQQLKTMCAFPADVTLSH